MLTILALVVFFIILTRICETIKKQNNFENQSHEHAEFKSTQRLQIEKEIKIEDQDTHQNLNNETQLIEIKKTLSIFKVETDSNVMHWSRPELGIGIVLSLHDNDKCTVKFNTAQFSGVPTTTFGDPKLIIEHYDKIRKDKVALENEKQNLIKSHKDEQERLINIKTNLPQLSKLEELRLAHDRFLLGVGKRNLGLQYSYKIHRVTHCYACKKPLDNSIDLECVACGWIICKCGACGCGWHGDF